MEHFYFIQFPEQIFNLRQNIPDGIPVIPFFDDFETFNRIIASLKRKESVTAVFYEKSSYPFELFLQNCNTFDYVFLTDSSVVKPLREAGFSGKIALFADFRMTAYPDFFKNSGVMPVVSGKSNFDLAKKNGLEPVYFVSDKACIAEFGLCLSRKSIPQNCFNCDNRCREKSTSKAGIEFPVSMKPDLCAPEDAPFLLFSEKTFFPEVKTSGAKEKILERSWNYRYPVGAEILKPGKTADKKSYSFLLDKNSSAMFDKGLIDFYGYSGAFYKGKWIEGVTAKKVGDSKLSAEISGAYDSVLMICRYTEEEKDFLKRARHHLYTLPLSEVLPKPEENTEKPEKKKSFRKYSERAKVTLISDDIKKFAAFKSKNIERRVLIYDRNIPKGFSDYIYVAGALNDKDIAEISEMAKLKGIVVPNAVMQTALGRIFPDREIILHPLSCAAYDDAPSYLSASTPIFVSRFRSENRNNYSWPDINIFLKNHIGFSEFISHKKMVRNGGKRELWVSIADISDDALRFLKSQADRMILEMR
ncbi:hypothetical protein J6253_04395 [bacterium]|nr:hypothetical protein [bacterium]